MSEARLSVTEVVYHFLPGQNPVSLPCRVNRRLASDEQAWVRRLTVGDQWQRLETGWLERCSLLRVANEEKPARDRPAPQVPQPAPQDGAERPAPGPAADRTVELGVGIDQGPPPGSPIEVTDVILPGESVRRAPPRLNQLWLRCRQGRAAVTVVIVPE